MGIGVPPGPASGCEAGGGVSSRSSTREFQA
jgi:hypothetical protein